MSSDLRHRVRGEPGQYVAVMAGFAASVARTSDEVSAAARSEAFSPMRTLDAAARAHRFSALSNQVEDDVFGESGVGRSSPAHVSDPHLENS